MLKKQLTKITIMSLIIPKIKMNARIQFFVVTIFALFLFKTLNNTSSSFYFLISNEILIGISAASLYFVLIEWVHIKKINPLTLVMNIGILVAVIFFLIIFFSSTFAELSGFKISGQASFGIFPKIISFVYGYILLGTSIYIFLAFRELYFFKQKGNRSTYFNTMLVFIILSSFSSILPAEIIYVQDTFFIISIFLIIFNSLKISWIAFIVKKDKKNLLFLSIIIAILFVMNLAGNTKENAGSQIIFQFSPILNQFLKIILIYGSVYFSILFFTTLFHIPTAEAFDRKAQEVSSLQYFSKLITEVLDFADLISTISDIAYTINRADASWIAWKENSDLKLLGNKNIGFINAELITGTAKEAKINFDLSETIFFPLDNYLNKLQLSELFSVVTISPLRMHNEIKGYIFTAKRENSVLDEEDKNALDTFADYASVALENSHLFEESIIKERLEKELDVAREVQRKILPTKYPEYKQLDISSLFIPAFEVGGDYYDFFEIDNDNFGFVIADVSGKGISAAFIMAEVKGIFESLSKIIKSPKEILVKANEILQRTLDRKSFVSAAYGLIDLKNETLRISRAGHCPVLLIRNNYSENMRPTGLGLGLNFTDYFADTLEELKIDLKENDTIVLYTDGITEAKNKLLEDFGSIRFEKILVDNCYDNADLISNKVIKEVTLFSQNNPQHDDITLVILKWKQLIKNYGEKEWQNSALQLKK